MSQLGRGSSVLFLDPFGGMLGAALLVWDAVPLRAGGPGLDLGAVSTVTLPLTLALGGIVGYVQALFARTSRHRWPVGSLLTGIVSGVVAHFVVSVVVQFGRVMPVPGGGASTDPSPGELRGGLLYWSAFVVAAITGLLLTARTSRD